MTQHDSQRLDDRHMAAEADVARASTTAGLPVSPSLGPTLEAADIPRQAITSYADKRVILICFLAIAIGAASAFIAQGLVLLIGLITNICFHARLSPADASPMGNHLGLLVIAIPVIGGIIVGLMARFGSPGIRGHGIPEAMEQVLANESRIAARLMVLKPLSAAVAIGTGGPFGVEGPIIATGGALGSVCGQILPVTAAERKTLLSAGAAAGMAATFLSPVSAVLLAIELLLFEFRPRSLIPVALASATAAGVRAELFVGHGPMFAMPAILPAPPAALGLYLVVGTLVGLLAVVATRAVYRVEDLFGKLPLHWMWWPAAGAVVVGVIGYFAPRTLGVGYDNIRDALAGHESMRFLLALCFLKLVSWAVALGSGTSGGTLAPLFTIGGTAGLMLGMLAKGLIPSAGVDPRIAALVGMAAIFAGASRAMLASVIFAFETTLQPYGVPPVLLGCSAAYLVSFLLLPQSIMTEKVVRKGVRVPVEYLPDQLAHIRVTDVMSQPAGVVRGDKRLGEIRTQLRSSNADGSGVIAVVDPSGALLGVVNSHDLLDGGQPDERSVKDLIRGRPIVLYSDSTLREALEQMVAHDRERLPVVARDPSRRLLGWISRHDLLLAQRSSAND